MLWLVPIAHHQLFPVLPPRHAYTVLLASVTTVVVVDLREYDYRHAYRGEGMGGLIPFREPNGYIRELNWNDKCTTFLVAMQGHRFLNTVEAAAVGVRVGIWGCCFVHGQSAKRRDPSWWVNPSRVKPNITGNAIDNVPRQRLDNSDNNTVAVVQHHP